MQRVSILSALGALALIASASCTDDSNPSITSNRQEATGARRVDADKTTAGSEGRMEPANKQALRVQRDAKVGNLEQEKVNEQAQADKARADSNGVTGAPGSAAQPLPNDKARADSNGVAGVPDSAGSPVPSDGQAQTISGQIASASDSQVELKSGDQANLKLSIDPSTAIRVDGQQGSASQITAGSDVRASYKTVDGRLTALRLDVTRNAANAGMPKDSKTDPKPGFPKSDMPKSDLPASDSPSK